MILKIIFKIEIRETPMSDNAVRLADLREGEHAILTELDLPHHTAEHLMCLGFIPGVEITVGKSGPGGDPRVYNVDGSNVALRHDVSVNLGVKPKLWKTQG
ncbi:MAG: ferrous iron transport protein A [Proteobacteria bacterium]|nr:MAG: ferrous iron transport protein A [Pseudomonadota bacterium]